MARRAAMFVHVLIEGLLIGVTDYSQILNTSTTPILIFKEGSQPQ